MKNYILHDPWNIIEEGFIPEHNRISESLFSIGNGRMGQRGNFEERYSGETLQGSYIAGIYYPDKTRVGWWKNGYPEYFAKVLNAANWIGIDIEVNGQALDLATCKVHQFRRVLNMREGYLERTFEAELPNGNRVAVRSTRFYSMTMPDCAAVRYSIRALNFDGTIGLRSYLDFDVINKDANYDEKFWEEVDRSVQGNTGRVTARTRKTDFHVCAGFSVSVDKNGEPLDLPFGNEARLKYVAANAAIPVRQGDAVTVYKYGAIVSSFYYEKTALTAHFGEALRKAQEKGFDAMLREQAAAWAAKWAEADIHIEGDVAAQQGIRFNIFQLYQTYTGDDERLNIGPKGFTGEKYGGSTYWDTEAYCLPFYLATADQHVARNLLMYRYKQLGKAIENAGKLGFTDGAALYPMVTMNGEECHNEWEITFEEIHRNGAIAYAIYDYTRYTGDTTYLEDYGIEVLIAIARFWSQRVDWSERKQQYVILGVTGPNEYENNVTNNWYTNYIAAWCLRYAAASIGHLKSVAPAKWAAVATKVKFDEKAETTRWQHIRDHLFFPVDPGRNIFLQQEDYLDKTQILVRDLDPRHLPLNQKWSWDRILRSCFIKQADVLQGLYFFEDDFDTDTIRRNFDFYEPRTVHESSLSPCVHAILAARIGNYDKAYEMYLRTARLDLDDYNNDTEDGCHITSMAGTWMSFVKGFGGMRVRDGQLCLHPYLPAHWQSYSFRLGFRGVVLDITVNRNSVSVENCSDAPITLRLWEAQVQVPARAKMEREALEQVW